jgi:hypothetical protein
MAGTECGAGPTACLLRHARVPIVEHLPDCTGLAFYLSESRIAALRVGLQLSTSGVHVKFFWGRYLFSGRRSGGLKKLLQILYSVL